MTGPLVVDMNLSPSWVTYLRAAGHPAVHWSAVGQASASDAVVMGWARVNGHAVLTHDLDFGTLLAATNAESPSVVLLRGDDVMPGRLGPAVLAAITHHGADLERGALLVIDARRARVRILPFQRPNYSE